MGRKSRGVYTRRDASQWKRLIAEHAHSGLSQRAFCERHGISSSSFGSWKRRLEAAPDREAEGAGFIEVALEPSLAQPWDVELTLGPGVVLRVRRR